MRSAPSIHWYEKREYRWSSWAGRKGVLEGLDHDRYQGFPLFLRRSAYAEALLSADGSITSSTRGGEWRKWGAGT